jgi:hypothetical protein
LVASRVVRARKRWRSVNWLLATLGGYRYSDRKERCFAPVHLAAFSRLAPPTKQQAWLDPVPPRNSGNIRSRKRGLGDNRLLFFLAPPPSGIGND